MNRSDPKLIALRFNECINNQDLNGLASLMTPDHAFIDRTGNVVQPRQVMLDCWKRFFEMYPHYWNTFEIVRSRENVVMICGHAYWSGDQRYDPAIWVATIVDDLVREWRIYDDTPENRRRFGLL